MALYRIATLHPPGYTVADVVSSGQAKHDTELYVDAFSAEVK
jgi:hypothetical protein